MPDPPQSWYGRDSPCPRNERSSSSAPSHECLDRRDERRRPRSGHRKPGADTAFARFTELTQLRDDLLPSVGMRNVLVHEYLEIDLRKAAAAIPLALNCYRRYVRQVVEFVSRID